METSKKAAPRPLYRNVLVIAAAFLAGLFFLSLMVFLLIPDDLIISRIKEKARVTAGIDITEKAFSKVFPLGVEFRAVEFSGAWNGRPLVLMDSFRADFKPLSLFAGKIGADFSGKAGDGGFTGSAYINGGRSFRTEGKGMDSRYIPVLAGQGIDLEGAFDFNISISDTVSGCPQGKVALKGKELRGGVLKVSGIPLPMGSIGDAGLDAELRDCKVRIKRFWIDGSELSATVYGEIPSIKAPFSDSPLDLTLEIIPRGEFLKKEFLLSLLGKYRRSANFFSIRVRGTVLHPEFMDG